jgi:hypothetical protein
LVEAAFQHFYYLFFFLPLRARSYTGSPTRLLLRCCCRLLMQSLQTFFLSLAGSGVDPRLP